MFISDIKRVIDQISRDKGIDRNVLIATLEEALKSAARKKLGNRIDIEVQYNEEIGEIEVFQFKEVAAVVKDPELEISIEEGRKLDPECEVGDSLGTKMDTTTFGRIAAQSAKQVIIQKMKDAERNAVYNNYIERKGEIVNGILLRINRGDIIVNLGQTEGILPVSEQVSRETFQRGDRIRAYILDVLQDTRGPQVILSRTHCGFLVQLFKTEVPEISEGIVDIMGAVREAGSRAKIAVTSSDSDIDPVGACVGMKGSRVQNVVQELKGEKIDIIPWHVDAAKYVCNALAPAQISRVIIDEENKSMEVIVPDEFLSIAIGKKGQNVRLASKLTHWHLDVKSEFRYSQAMRNGYDSLLKLPDISVSVADSLYEKGFYSLEEVGMASIDDLLNIKGIDEEMAVKLIDSAKKAARDKKVGIKYINDIKKINKGGHFKESNEKMKKNLKNRSIQNEKKTDKISLNKTNNKNFDKDIEKNIDEDIKRKKDDDDINEEIDDNIEEESIDDIEENNDDDIDEEVDDNIEEESIDDIDENNDDDIDKEIDDNIEEKSIDDIDENNDDDIDKEIDDNIEEESIDDIDENNDDDIDEEIDNNIEEESIDVIDEEIDDNIEKESIDDINEEIDDNIEEESIDDIEENNDDDIDEQIEENFEKNKNNDLTKK